ncbi:MAG: hypothetical protein PHD32_12405 [Eubacteriales bacterium]|nr:hypothetical protein [Eubacteriales bacterium]
MKIEEIRSLTEAQFAVDYNCAVRDFESTETLVTRQRRTAGERRFEKMDCPLAMLTYRGKLVISAAEELYDWCENTLKKQRTAPWCFEAASLIGIDRKLREYGWRIDQAHLFFLPKTMPQQSEIHMRVLGNR